MTTEYTDHFRLNLPDFRMGPWHDLVNEDFVTIDQLLFSLYQGVDTQVWANNTHYTPGQTAIDSADNSFWVCIVEHTSAPTGTFAADRAAHPGYWNRVVVGIAPRGEWMNSTHYLPNDMVSDSSEHVIAVCKTEHTSNASGTIRDDEAYWTFIADIGSAAATADNVSYDNSVSGATGTNLQVTTDDLYAKHNSQAAAITANSNNITTNTNNISSLTTRMTNTENVNTTQDGRLTSLESATATHISDAPNDGTLYGRKNAGWIAVPAPGISDAPVDGNTYARKNAAWLNITSAIGSSTVYVQDTPPVGAPVNSLWWESDSGMLYVYYNDGNTTQWVAAVPIPDTTVFVSKAGDTMTGLLTLSGDPATALQAATKQYVDNRAVRYDIAQSLTTAQKTQARANIDVMKKNYIVNGAMQISQENGGTAGTVNGYYPADQFTIANASAVTFSAAQISSLTTGGSPNRLRVTATSAATPASGTYLTIRQKIEGLRVADLLFGTSGAKAITVQFGVKAPAGTYGVSVYNSAANRVYAGQIVIAAGEANTDVVKIVTIPGDTSGTWLVDNTVGLVLDIVLTSAGTAQIAPNVWTASPAGFYTNAQSNFFATNGNIFELFDVGLYEGSAAPSFQVPDFPTEQSLCKRYYCKENFTWRVNGLANAIYCFQLPFPVAMRQAPTMTLSGTSRSNVTSPSFVNIDVHGAGFQTTVTANGDAYVYNEVLTRNARL